MGRRGGRTAIGEMDEVEERKTTSIEVWWLDNRLELNLGCKSRLQFSSDSFSTRGLCLGRISPYTHADFPFLGR